FPLAVIDGPRVGANEFDIDFALQLAFGDVELQLSRAGFCKRADFVVAAEELEIIRTKSSGFDDHAAFGDSIFPAFAGDVIAFAAFALALAFALGEQSAGGQGSGDPR